MAESRQQSAARRLLALLAETSVHAGTGAQLGAVDLPIQRERHTNWPTIHGSGLKGVFRDHAEAEWGAGSNLVRALFGPSTDANDDTRHAGAIAISDARLLVFPVRTVGHPFAWVTCPLALARLGRDAADVGLDGVPSLDRQPTADRVLVAPAWHKDIAQVKRVLLEEFDYEAEPAETVAKAGNWIGRHLLPASPPYGYWRDLIDRALVIVADDEFRDLVQHGTEVVTRVRLGEGKTVEKGALWTEENLPADTLLYSFVASWTPVNGQAASVPDAPAAMARLSELLKGRSVLQVGGKETVGRGFMAARLTE
jgi:CRISPR-associated protein Cmr4